MKDKGEITFEEWLHCTDRLLKRIGMGIVRRFSQKWVWQVIGIVILLAFALTATLLGLGSLNHWWKNRKTVSVITEQQHAKIDDTRCLSQVDYSVERDSSGYGLLDLTTGAWAVKPCYDEVFPISSHQNGKVYWVLSRGDSLRVLDDTFREVLPLQEGDKVEVNGEGVLVLWYYDRPGRRFSMSGEMLPGLCFHEVNEIMYKNEAGIEVPCPNNLVYSVDGGMMGLLSRSGEPLTRACYVSIEALGPNLFSCEDSSLDFFVILDQNGHQQCN